MAMNIIERLRGSLTRNKSDADKLAAPVRRPRRTRSTDRYRPNYEPYATFQPKVQALTESIGNFESILLEHRKGGTFNRVVVAHLRARGQKIEGVYRISRADEKPQLDAREKILGHDIQDQVTVLQLLARRSIPAPRLLAFDASRGNPLNCRYILTSLSSGCRLHDIYDSMTLPEKLNVVDGIVEFLLIMELVTFPLTGIITSSHEPGMAIKGSLFLDIGLPKFERYIQEFWVPGNVDMEDSLGDYLPSMLKARFEGEDRDTGSRLLANVCKISNEMKQHGIFNLRHKDNVSTSRSILHQWDLFPRNIMVAKSGPQQEWKIDMVIDWDHVQAVPAVLTRRPPFWLWDREDIYRMPNVRSDFADAGNERFSPDDQQIRNHFEERLILGLGDIYGNYTKEDYHDEAYERGRWIRRLAHLAFDNLSESYIPVIAHFENDWETFMRGHPVDPPKFPLFGKPGPFRMTVTEAWRKEMFGNPGRKPGARDYLSVLWKRTLKHGLRLKSQ
ncbi:hypothetical protein K470DRAFT_295574 [Piedraia hortae CBS 480.64]|uniref:Uncharacterized protein n=1 Tax=Piedraia hortae CBS 480.64 TaxID=1314780 RepID=A0A6A7BWG7_9PEZI|nr:hypothetical protein K470DRAFT_295574 [Piedraia hortae CBS 480.64]